MGNVTGFTKADDNTNITTGKNKALAFVNWSVPTTIGGTMRSSKGFPIFDNPEYPNPEEALLVALAEKHGGTVELTMKVRVTLNQSKEGKKEFDLNSIAIG